MEKKIFFLLSVAAVALSLSGCFAGVETRSGWHMVSLPPSSGKRLSAQCSGMNAVQSYMVGGALELVKELEAKQDATYKGIIQDLQTENAVLRAVNEHLRGLSKIDQRNSEGLPAVEFPKTNGR